MVVILLDVEDTRSRFLVKLFVQNVIYWPLRAFSSALQNPMMSEATRTIVMAKAIKVVMPTGTQWRSLRGRAGLSELSTPRAGPCD